MEKTPEQIRGLSRTAIPLSRAGVLGLPALRALGTDLVIASETVLTGSDDLVLPPTLGQLIDELAAPGHGVILAMGKGGVGKTTVAAAVAMALAERGLGVHLSTTDPAAHVSATIDRDVLPNFTVSRIDPAGETARYTEQVIRESGGDLDASGKALLAEDLRSPCTEEIAVFRAFAEAVAEGSDRFVVLDTAPTGHTILLLDAALAYHREVTRQAHQMPESVERLLPRLRDAAFTRVLVVTLPEATPVHEAAQLQRDLRRAEIEPYAWIINQSLAPLPVIDPVLKSRQVAERAFIREVVSDHAARVALVPWQPEPPVGRSGLRRLLTMSGQASARQDVNWQLSGNDVAEESAPL